MPVILNDEAVFKEKLYSNFMKKNITFIFYNSQSTKSSQVILIYSAFNNECRFFQSIFTEINL